MFPVLNVMSCQSFNSFSILGYQLGEKPSLKIRFLDRFWLHQNSSDPVETMLWRGVIYITWEEISSVSFILFGIFRKIKFVWQICLFLKIGTKRAAKSTFIKFDLTAVSFYLDNISNKAHDKLLVLIISYFHKKHKVFSRHENGFMVLHLVIFICFVH